MKTSRFHKIVCWAMLCLVLYGFVGCAASPSGSGSLSGSVPSSSLQSGSVGSGSGSDVSGSIPGDVQPTAENGIYEPEYAVQAEGVYLVNEDSGVVVYAKNPNQQFVAASLVKMMTCLIVMDMVEDIDAETVTAETWVFNELYGLNASTADIWKGETLTMRELLYAMLLPSANEAALMAAGYVSRGYMPNFLYLMNQKAEMLGCTGTVFADPNGLSQNNLTTAHDMYLITREFMQNPVLVEIAATPTYEMAAHNHGAPYNILTTNRLLVASDPYAKRYSDIAASIVAGKTGSLGNEWQNFVSMARKNDMTYYCVVLHSPQAADAVAAENESSRTRPALVETGELYSWVFSGYTVKPALDVTKPITEITVKYSTAQDSVMLMPDSGLKTLLPVSGEQKLELEFDLPEFVAAPVQQGQVVGTVTLLLQGHVLGTVNLVAAQDVKRNTYKYMLQRVGEFFKAPVVIVVIVLAVLAVGGYFGLMAYAGYRYRKRGSNPPPRRSGGNKEHPKKKPPPGAQRPQNRK